MDGYRSLVVESEGACDVHVASRRGMGKISGKSGKG